MEIKGINSVLGQNQKTWITRAAGIMLVITKEKLWLHQRRSLIRSKED